MDLTKAYINMRLKAIPYLGMGTPPEKLSSWVGDDVFIDMNGNFYYSVEGVCCQLERQDQLQSMVREHFKNELDLFIDMYAWYERNRPKDAREEWETIEQLWFAFVMKEKVNKVWDGEHWVKE